MFWNCLERLLKRWRRNTAINLDADVLDACVGRIRISAGQRILA